MNRINFNDKDIKECKLALVNQNLTSLQSAFLMQHITNLEQALIDIKDKILNYNPYFQQETLQIIVKVLGGSDE